MVSSKLLWNSTISTKGAHFAGADIKNMYLDTPLDWYEYMKMPLSLFSQDIIEHYGLLNKVLNGCVYTEICKGMYGLPQAGILANKLLKKCLAKHRYYEQLHTLAYGGMNPIRYDSTWWLTFLGSNILVKTTTFPGSASVATWNLKP
jgi:hypothetical protein